MLKTLFGGLTAAVASIASLGAFSEVKAESQSTRSINGKIKYISNGEDTSADSHNPLFSDVVVHNGLVYLSGIGYHKEGDITKATTEVLNAIEQKLNKAGSSMHHVLKVNVHLADLADYDEMNKAYRGRFGNRAPVRTTVAVYGGVPGNSLVEIDCIAALK